MPKLQLIFLVLPYSSCGTKHWKFGNDYRACPQKAKPVKLTSLANFGRPSRSGTKRGLKDFVIEKIFQIRQMHHRFTHQTPLEQQFEIMHATNSSEMHIEKSKPLAKKLCETESQCFINQNERKRKNEGIESSILKKKPSALETSRSQLSKLSNFVNVDKQNPVPLGKFLGPRPPQPQPQLQQYELIIRNRKISRCNGCLNEFNRKNPKLCIIGRNEYDWHVNVNKQEDTKMYKSGRQKRYYCTRKQCILARRPFLNIAEIEIITKERERIGREHVNELQDYFGVTIKDNEQKPTKFIGAADEETNPI